MIGISYVTRYQWVIDSKNYMAMDFEPFGFSIDFTMNFSNNTLTIVHIMIIGWPAGLSQVFYMYFLFHVHCSTNYNCVLGHLFLTSILILSIPHYYFVETYPTWKNFGGGKYWQIG